MTGLEITLFILGTAFIIISFFIVDNSEKTPKSIASRALDADAFEQMGTDFKEKSAREADIILHETEDKLESLSNDKIIAVGEYSDQIIEKINANHKEVVFLYQMLNDKEEELKSAAEKMDNIRIECEKMLKNAEELRNAAQTAESDMGLMNSGQKTEEKTSADRATPASQTSGIRHVIPGTIKKSTSDTRRQNTTAAGTSVKRTAPSTEKLDTGSLSRNDEIIALYKSGKSVMEISKLLGMGQGEVKLIIDLYC